MSASDNSELQAFLDASTWTPPTDKRERGPWAAFGGVVVLAVTAAGIISLLAIPYAMVTAEILSQVDGTQVNMDAFWALFRK